MEVHKCTLLPNRTEDAAQGILSSLKFTMFFVLSIVWNLCSLCARPAYRCKLPIEDANYYSLCSRMGYQSRSGRSRTFAIAERIGELNNIRESLQRYIRCTNKS